MIIERYLGSSSGSPTTAQGQSFVTICSSVKKDVIDAFAKKPAMLQSSESFLKSVLRHYKVDVNSAQVQELLHARAKLYYRVGRLLQAWPQHQVTSWLTFSHGTTPRVCGCLYGGLPPLYVPPGCSPQDTYVRRLTPMLGSR